MTAGNRIAANACYAASATGQALDSCWQSLVAASATASHGETPVEGPFTVSVQGAGTEDSKVLR